MSLQGLPDFQQPIQADGFQILFPYQDGGTHVLTPDQLEIAEHDDRRPDFMLVLVRGKNPLLPPQPYGVLDFKLRPRYRMQEALALLRSRYPNATLDSVVFSSGFLRLRPIGDVDVPADLLKPVPLSWNGLGSARCILKFSRDTAVLLKQSLERELLGLQASAEMEMVGVSPRLPVRVRFNPAKLLSALLTLADNERRVAREQVAAFFRRNPRLLPLEIAGEIEGPKQDEFAEALTDRVRVRFGTFVSSPKEAAGSYLLLDSPEEIGTGTFEWDLLEPIQVPRPLVLNLHPLEAIRKFVKAQGLESVFRETTVPPLSTGFLAVSVTANLPPERPTVVSIGVTVRIPPKPPQRFQAVIASAELKPPQDTASVLLRLSPVEKPEYTYSTFAVLNNSRGIQQLEGTVTPHAGDRLDLTLDDFPVDFTPVEASPALLQLSVIQGICRWSEVGLKFEQRFELNESRPVIALALPKGTEGATLEIEARAREGSRTLKLGPFPTRPLQLDLHTFPEYGPHRIEIECLFGNNSQSFAIDLLPEGSPETREEITVLSFVPTRPTKEWTWFAASPFRPGYRYRPHRLSGQPTAVWSEVLSPFEPLKIRLEATAGGAS